MAALTHWTRVLLLTELSPGGGWAHRLGSRVTSTPAAALLSPPVPSPPKGSNYLFLCFCTSILLYKYTTSQISILLFTPSGYLPFWGPDV